MILVEQRFKDIFGSEHILHERVEALTDIDAAKKRIQDVVKRENGVLLGIALVSNEDTVKHEIYVKNKQPKQHVEFYVSTTKAGSKILVGKIYKDGIFLGEASMQLKHFNVELAEKIIYNDLLRDYGENDGK